MKRNAFARFLFSDTHKLEFSIWNSTKALRTYGRVPSSEDLQHNRAYAFMYVFNRVYSAISQSGRKRLLGSVQSGFVDENNLSSLEHEIKTIGHFINIGGEIECHDLEEGGFDFICHRSGVEFEIECKTVSVDKGRQIHRHDLLSLADHLVSDIATLANQPNGFGTIVSVKLPSRLTRIPTELKELAADVKNVFETRRPIASEKWEVSAHQFLISDSPFGPGTKFDRHLTQDFVKKFIPDSTGQHLVSVTPGFRAAILDVHSAKPDRYVSEIYRGLKEGAAQFSRQRPAVIVAAILDFSSQDLEAMSRDPRDNGFQAIATRLFRSEQRAHLHTVMFTGDVVLRRKAGGSVSSSGASLNFRNLSHPLFEDPRLRLTLDK